MKAKDLDIYDLTFVLHLDAKELQECDCENEFAEEVLTSWKIGKIVEHALKYRYGIKAKLVNTQLKRNEDDLRRKNSMRWDTKL